MTVKVKRITKTLLIKVFFEEILLELDKLESLTKNVETFTSRIFMH